MVNKPLILKKFIKWCNNMGIFLVEDMGKDHMKTMNPDTLIEEWFKAGQP